MSSFHTLPSAERSAVLSLLSRLFLREADGALLQALMREDIAGTLDGLAPGTRAEVAGALEDEHAREELDAEYCRLFILPKGISPFAATWSGEGPPAESGVLEEQIGALFDALGMRPQEGDFGRLPLDHVGILLALASEAATRDEQGELAQECLAILRTGRDGFAAAVAAETTSCLYRASALLLGEVLRPELSAS